MEKGFHSLKEDSRGRYRFHVPIASRRFHSLKEDSRDLVRQRPDTRRPVFPFLKGRFKRYHSHELLVRPGRVSIP